MKQKRRTFLKTAMCGTGVLAAGELLASGRGTPSQGRRFNMCGYAAPKMDQVRIGFIGVGARGGGFGGRGVGAVERFTFLDGVKLTAFSDLYEDRIEYCQQILAKKGLPRARGYSGSREGWKAVCESSDIDLVYICTPWALHTPMAVYAMACGKHVAVEGVGEEAVREIAVYRNPQLKPLADGSIEIPFTGNRVDALPADYDYRVNGDAVADILIDGRKPSSFPEAYAFTRPSAAPYVWWPAFKVLRRNAAPVAETWELTVLDSSPDGKRLRFRVAGSVTGEDGEGSSEETFVSKSGRVVIDGGRAWTVQGALSYRKKEMPVGYRVSWAVVPRFRDALAYPDSQLDGTDNAVTLIEGIANGPHVLRIVPRPGHPLKLRAVRVYRPPQNGGGEKK